MLNLPLSTLRFFATVVVVVLPELLPEARLLTGLLLPDARMVSPPNTDSELTTIVSVKLEVVNFWPSVSLVRAFKSLLILVTGDEDEATRNIQNKKQICANGH